MKTESEKDLRPVRPAPAPAFAPAAPAASREERPLAEYVALVASSGWLVVLSLAVALTLGVAYVALAAPRYRTDILVQVEAKDEVPKLDAVLEDLIARNMPAETETEVLRSRAVIGQVVDDLSLDLVVRPRTVPLVGDALLRWRSDGELRPAPWRLARFAWGGERIKVAQLDVTGALLGEPLTLIAGANGAYSVRDAHDRVLVDGRVGGEATGGGVSVLVDELRARPGTEFTISRVPRATAIHGLQEDLEISEKGKKTGLLSVALEGEDPRRIATILDSVGRAYLRLNQERKSAETRKTLALLEQRLPELKTRLDAAEGALQAYRDATGTVSVSVETDALTTRAIDVQRALSELELQRSELATHATDRHPAMAELNGKIASLQQERASIESRMKRLPKAERDSARLARDAKVASDVYVLLLGRVQTLRVVQSGTTGGVRLLDAAIVPVEPVSPRAGQALALSALLGLSVGLGLASLRRALTRRVESADAIERETGLEVYATIPRSAGEARLQRQCAEPGVLALADPHDVAVENFRSLRTTVQCALRDAPNRVISLVGPAPGIGRSFASANLATVLAEPGTRVLLIDADVRKGRLHECFGGARDKGLMELVAATATADQVVRQTAIPNLDFVAAGRMPPNFPGLLGSDRFGAVLRDLAARYDVVVVDTPPVLAVTDAVLVARHCGVNLMLLRAGKHTWREIETALRRCDQGGVLVSGVVLNDVQPRSRHADLNGYRYYDQYARDSKQKQG